MELYDRPWRFRLSLILLNKDCSVVVAVAVAVVARLNDQAPILPIQLRDLVELSTLYPVMALVVITPRVRHPLRLPPSCLQMC